ncbi:hypothetical protein EQG49_13405 [Periweissella cryptocerci]|uniref:Uncharacterized protein n=1 Tax=Periweissella cryptocerci TaxID=2506420 RepID=A0A4P6YX13_9LACO|nr:hypothetical protein [Periweissella cryptocerci]QBO37394.1 hypothetical protein EQG49_13405 [Periweissella cryptocerci]
MSNSHITKELLEYLNEQDFTYQQIADFLNTERSKIGALMVTYEVHGADTLFSKVELEKFHRMVFLNSSSQAIAKEFGLSTFVIRQRIKSLKLRSNAKLDSVVFSNQIMKRITEGAGINKIALELNVSNMRVFRFLIKEKVIRDHPLVITDEDADFELLQEAVVLELTRNNYSFVVISVDKLREMLRADSNVGEMAAYFNTSQARIRAVIRAYKLG